MDERTNGDAVASELGELRGPCPVDILNALDAVCISRSKGSVRVPRHDVVNEILYEWRAAKIKEAQLILRLTGEPVAPEMEVK